MTTRRGVLCSFQPPPLLIYGSFFFNLSFSSFDIITNLFVIMKSNASNSVLKVIKLVELHTP